MLVQELDTPSLIVDLDVMEANLRRVADYAKQHSLRLRPHTKTHKSIGLARRQIALGAAGLTVAKVTEAEVMAAANPADLLVAYPVFGAPKLRRLTEVARRTKVAVALDSLASATPLSEAAVIASVDIGVMVEVDVGLGRVGVQPAEALALAQTIAALPNLHFRGLTFYPGHIKQPTEALVKGPSGSSTRISWPWPA